jgi:hypothetical protein
VSSDLPTAASRAVCRVDLYEVYERLL